MSKETDANAQTTPAQEERRFAVLPLILLVLGLILGAVVLAAVIWGGADEAPEAATALMSNSVVQPAAGMWLVGSLRRR